MKIFWFINPTLESVYRKQVVLTKLCKMNIYFIFSIYFFFISWQNLGKYIVNNFFGLFFFISDNHGNNKQSMGSWDFGHLFILLLPRMWTQKVPSIYYVKHLYNTKLNLITKFFIKTVFFRQNKRVYFSTLRFDKIFIM